MRTGALVTLPDCFSRNRLLAIGYTIAFIIDGRTSLSGFFKLNILFSILLINMDGWTGHRGHRFLLIGAYYYFKFIISAMFGRQCRPGYRLLAYSVDWLDKAVIILLVAS